MQQDLLRKRMLEFAAAVLGDFTVLDAENRKLTTAPSLLPNETRLTIKWRRSVTPHDTDYLFDEINFLNSPSLAQELFTVQTGLVDDFRALDGGLLYLVGARGIFWSMAQHLREQRARNNADPSVPITCVPPPPPGLQWELHTWVYTEMARANRALSAGGRPAGSVVQLSSEYLLATVMGNEQLRSQLENRRIGYDEPDETVPHVRDGLPLWWIATESLWNGALLRAMERGPQCLYYCTPVGCLAGADVCPAWHDPEWQTEIAVCKLRG
jgi:hypothetical protein